MTTIKLVDARRGLYEKCKELFSDKMVADQIYYYLCDGIEECEYAEPKRKKGRWIVHKAPDKYHCGLIECPFCGEEGIAEADEYNYCPSCGSDMRGERDETSN